MQAEREKQDELRNMEKEKAILIEMVKQREDEVEDLTIQNEKLQKETQAKLAQDKVALNESHKEMRTLKDEYEDVLMESKRKMVSLEENIADLSR